MIRSSVRPSANQVLSTRVVPSSLDKIRRAAFFLRRTPIHPQWFSFRDEHHASRRICAQANGIVLDIGCGHKRISKYLPVGCQYVGLDYPETAINWYRSHPEVYGDARALPVGSGTVDTVLLLDVLEHLSNPDACLGEVKRVLKDDGALCLQVPFLYPLHDAPRDFHRWTIHGLEQAVRAHGFAMIASESIGQPLETAALLTNIAASKTAINWLQTKHPASILVLLLPLFVLFSNTMAWLLSAASPRDFIMPRAYRIWCKKTKA